MRKHADGRRGWRNIRFFHNTRYCDLVLHDRHGVARVTVIATSLTRWRFPAYWLLLLLHVFFSSATEINRYLSGKNYANFFCFDIFYFLIYIYKTYSKILILSSILLYLLCFHKKFILNMFFNIFFIQNACIIISFKLLIYFTVHW